MMLVIFALESRIILMSLLSWLSGSKANTNPKKKAVHTTRKISSSCPYCHVSLEKTPGRKSKCPHCGKDMYVRTTQKIFDSHLLTKDQALATDAIRENAWNGLDADVFRTLIQSRPHDKPTDVLWNYFQKKNLEMMKRGDFQALKMLNYSMALFLNKEGRDHRHCLQAAARYQLEQFLQEGFVGNVHISVGENSCCDACKRNAHKVLSLKEAIKDLPIPCKDCSHVIHNDTYGFCRCIYVTDRFI
ncbi:hypothetical protein A3C37_01425 [Candidatus Peribacteria bacterium RIFCSPHIGHO2_02_FULL_53_20]|nr:MAG: hypothetical protein A3C37_01425 [Candidatus Peribacteria bacterium RIFCSPHIGHO2_02_FULL_53_20]OGJ67164.1 MAG: hypothetical protein A3B61_03235 [Candidatus Peribacteria bacterium RIFCSPLOWO2_01_FULL_53_10]OGJ75001.1 MAG: hypothetical protein A3G69_00740 [Candidatus Peribacteria bacterium RIFCSPLOWO2_12_FULL_53_10]